MKKYLTSILLLSSLLLAELHTFWENASKKPVNWIIGLYVPMPVQQNVKMVTDELWYILIFGIMIVILRGGQNNRINRTTLYTFFCFAVIDMLFYFYNYKTENYSIVYFLLAVIWILIYRYGGRNKAAIK